MRIAMPRGDIRLVRFLVNDIGGIATDIDFSEIRFTVKKTSGDRASLFQKTLTAGEILKLGPDDYQVRIEPGDTEQLSYGKYKFGVQLEWVDEKNVQQLKETFTGDFVINEEMFTQTEDYDPSDVDNRSIISGNFYKLTLRTPVAHKVPAVQNIEGGELTAGAGTATIESDGYYNGVRVVTSDKIQLLKNPTEGYYQITASGKGVVNKGATTRQAVEAGFIDEDYEPITVIPADSLESETAEEAYYIKKSTPDTDRVTPDQREQTVIINEGYYPTKRTIYIDPVIQTFPRTSLDAINMSTYFYSANQNEYDIRIIPRFSNPAGFVVESTNANNGGTEYYKVKKTDVTETPTTVAGTEVSRGTASWGKGWIESGQIAAATFKNTATSGTNYVDISETDEAPVLIDGDYLYINAGYVDNLKISLDKLTGKTNP